MLIIESINISLLGLYPWKCSCMNPFHLGRFSSLLNDKDDCQRISIRELLGTKGCKLHHRVDFRQTVHLIMFVPLNWKFLQLSDVLRFQQKSQS